MAAVCVVAPSNGPREVFVSAKGDDASADGSSAAPFRSITRALRALDGAAGRATIRLAMGQYDATTGEAFPLRIPAGVHVRGHGSQLCVIEGSADATLLTTTESSGARTVLEGVALRAAACGVLLEAPADRDHSVQLNDVLLENLGVGVDVRLGRAGDGSVMRLHADGARFRGCERGIATRGESPFELELTGCSFRGGKVAIALDSTTEEGKGVHHRLHARGCRFEEHSVAGVQRTGPDGTNRASQPYRFDDCVFRGNRVGIELQRPSGDTPLSIRRSAFFENELFGLQSTGQFGDPELTSHIEDSTFRWNGVGLHIVNVQLRYEVRRNRIVDNLGNGVFYASFDAEMGRASFANNLVAHNGATGVFLLADNRRLGVDLVHDTIVDNAGSGIERKHRHGGHSSFNIVGCIVEGNAPDLVGILDDEVRSCLVGDAAPEGGGNLTGDPGFVDSLGRDYHLAPDSPCLDRGVAEAAEPGGPTDLAGRPRTDGKPDLGAFER